jgi:hypothetical protein
MADLPFELGEREEERSTISEGFSSSVSDDSEGSGSSNWCDMDWMSSSSDWMNMDAPSNPDSLGSVLHAPAAFADMQQEMLGLGAELGASEAPAALHGVHEVFSLGADLAGPSIPADAPAAAMQQEMHWLGAELGASEAPAALQGVHEVCSLGADLAGPSIPADAPAAASWSEPPPAALVDSGLHALGVDRIDGTHRQRSSSSAKRGRTRATQPVLESSGGSGDSFSSANSASTHPESGLNMVNPSAFEDVVISARANALELVRALFYLMPALFSWFPP